MARTKDSRPPMAVGHVSLRVRNVASSATFFDRLGLRPIFRGSDIAIFELRGGTHLLLFPTRAAFKNDREAPFDLMVDDIAATHRAVGRKGLRPSALDRGRIHDSFVLREPSGWRITIHSTHASGRPV
ncbi:MAG: VOC family protein [Rhodospirillales bacterium]|nr:VOC family protein [Rhodospirillales bacterium]